MTLGDTLIQMLLDALFEALVTLITGLFGVLQENFLAILGGIP